MIRRWRARRGAPILALITWLYILWSLVPVLVAVRVSFNDGRSRSTFQPMSMRWYWGDPLSSVWHDDDLHVAMVNTLKLAGLCVLIATPIGVAMAIGLQRWRGRSSNAANGLMLVPIVTPEIVFGVSLFLVFTQLYTNIPSGLTRQLLGHVTFTISFVVVIIRGRLASIGAQYEEAARDLGATRWQAIRLVLLPMLAPAIFASVMVVFATSIDDFVISSFLSTGEATETVPIKIYAASRSGSTPAINALATVMMGFTLLAVTLAAIVLRRMNRRGGDGGTGGLAALST
ncbi:MAG TPA: ABC transporter permease [Ilumatobacteraceae bacterium]|nr:ABC transporter permease [Ilumatobacteraceae bacterium]HUC33301.1 ABC transporter permease [Ilumatobacteraceae bacterium]